MKRPYFFDREPIDYLRRPAPYRIPLWFVWAAFGLGVLAGLILRF